MKFRFKGDITFEAHDIDNAFIVLAEHFLHQVEEELGRKLDFLGELNIDPVGSEQEST